VAAHQYKREEEKIDRSENKGSPVTSGGKSSTPIKGNRGNDQHVGTIKIKTHAVLIGRLPQHANMIAQRGGTRDTLKETRLLTKKHGSPRMRFKRKKDVGGEGGNVSGFQFWRYNMS